MVTKSFDRVSESLLIPPRVALLAEEYSTLIVVNAMDLPPFAGKVDANFGAD